MKPLKKEMKQNNIKNFSKSNKSESIKVTKEDNHVYISEKNLVTEKKQLKKRRIKKIEVLEENDNPKETKCLLLYKIKNFLKKHKLLSILSLILILILVIILIYFTTKKNNKNNNLDIPSKSSNGYIPSEPESKPVANYDAIKNLIFLQKWVI